MQRTSCIVYFALLSLAYPTVYRANAESPPDEGASASSSNVACSLNDDFPNFGYELACLYGENEKVDKASDDTVKYIFPAEVRDYVKENTGLEYELYVDATREKPFLKFKITAQSYPDFEGVTDVLVTKSMSEKQTKKDLLVKKLQTIFGDVGINLSSIELLDIDSNKPKYADFQTLKKPIPCDEVPSAISYENSVVPKQNGTVPTASCRFILLSPEELEVFGQKYVDWQSNERGVVEPEQTSRRLRGAEDDDIKKDEEAQEMDQAKKEQNSDDKGEDEPDTDNQGKDEPETESEEGKIESGSVAGVVAAED